MSNSIRNSSSYSVLQSQSFDINQHNHSHSSSFHATTEKLSSKNSSKSHNNNHNSSNDSNNPHSAVYKRIVSSPPLVTHLHLSSTAASAAALAAMQMSPSNQLYNGTGLSASSISAPMSMRSATSTNSNNNSTSNNNNSNSNSSNAHTDHATFEEELLNSAKAASAKLIGNSNNSSNNSNSNSNSSNTNAASDKKPSVCCTRCTAFLRYLVSPSFLLRVFLLLILATLITLAVIFWSYVQAFFVAALAYIQGLGMLKGAIVLTVANIIGAVLFLPCVPFTLGAGFLFGLQWGSLIIIIASNIASLVAFITARYLLRSCVERHLGGKNSKFRLIDAAIKQDGFKIVCLVRSSPMHPYGICNYLFGLTSVTLPSYVLANLIAMTPGTILEVWTGTSIHQLSDIISGEADESDAHQILFWVALVVTLIVTAIMTLWLRSKLKQELLSHQLKDEDNESNNNNSSSDNSKAGAGSTGNDSSLSSIEMVEPPHSTRHSNNNSGSNNLIGGSNSSNNAGGSVYDLQRSMSDSHEADNDDFSHIDIHSSTNSDSEHDSAVSSSISNKNNRQSSFNNLHNTSQLINNSRHHYNNNNNSNSNNGNGYQPMQPQHSNDNNNYDGNSNSNNTPASTNRLLTGSRPHDDNNDASDSDVFDYSNSSSGTNSYSNHH